MRRALPARQVQAKPVYGGLTHIVQALPPLTALALLHLRHRLIVLRPFGPVIALGIAERDSEGAVAHQLFDDFQGGPSIEQLRGKRMPQRVGRIGLSDACQQVLSQFLFEAICGMILPYEQRSIMRESDDGGQFQRGPFPPRGHSHGGTLVCGVPAEHTPR